MLGRFYHLQGIPVRISKAQTLELQQLLFTAGWPTVKVVVFGDNTAVLLDSGCVRGWCCVYDNEYLDAESEVTPPQA